ncbi:MAG: hypothetical protein IPH82_29170 [Chloroflexi bacterium]|nr:hypothetical protein [Chloroflexota bacterium]
MFHVCCLDTNRQLYHYLGKHLFSTHGQLFLPWSGNKDFDWLFSVPHFWQRLASLDLAQLSWLNLADRNVLLASLPLVLYQFFANSDSDILLINLPQPEEAIDQFCQQLGVENQKEQVMEQLAKTVQHLLTDLVKHLSKSSVVLVDAPVTFSSLEDLFSSNEEGMLLRELH